MILCYMDDMTKIMACVQDSPCVSHWLFYWWATLFNAGIQLSRVEE